jgi:hypothetical protein
MDDETIFNVLMRESHFVSNVWGWETRWEVRQSRYTSDGEQWFWADALNPEAYVEVYAT